ncbi:DUF6306 domain-containing protein [Zavarzinia compransoris]|uniref:DUF6306 domain-containing protein n=1 Tax=Zavarzinia compransoris TaxID=1264899 RepID=A0A317DXN4_9PROT|nr:DUF6306 domain-containing protein [Zavarzinia compransoris]PWR17723.1 hypothetical protein DKG75_21480 [Zavarzinia compransoris]TDP49246.1 hypothetical protein DES42_101616 [Zavarzinia compransoris]
MTAAKGHRAGSVSDLPVDADGDLRTPNFNGPLTDSELAALINLLIESIRAGAKVAAVFACRAACQDRRGMYLDIQSDASKAIQHFSRILKARGVEPSDATSGFFDRAIDLPEKADRVAFFARGQDWLLATLQEALPHLQDPELIAVFRECAETAKRNRERALTYKPAV